MSERQVEHPLDSALARLNGNAWGIAIGLLFGGGLFLATVILVLQGGENVGAHLGLLRAYFPGYTVIMVGGILGLAYGFVTGYVVGQLIGFVYNRLATGPSPAAPSSRSRG